MDHHAHHQMDLNHSFQHHMGGDSVPVVEETMGHDHMGMDPGMHMMPMSFYFGLNATVLFSSWQITTVGEMIGSFVGIFILAAVYEGIKYYREYLFWKYYNSLQYRSVQLNGNKISTREGNSKVHVVGEVIHRQPPSMLSVHHALQTVLHIIQITLSYFLMLIFMTYNAWLCIAVVLGAALGYFLFGWKKSVIVDVTEHCH